MALRVKSIFVVLVLAAQAQGAVSDYQCGERFQAVLNEINVDAATIKAEKVSGSVTDTMLLAGKEFASSSTAMVSKSRITDISVDIDERTELIALEQDCSVKRIVQLDPMGPIEVSPQVCALTNDPRQIQVCTSYEFLMRKAQSR